MTSQENNQWKDIPSAQEDFRAYRTRQQAHNVQGIVQMSKYLFTWGLALNSGGLAVVAYNIQKDHFWTGFLFFTGVLFIVIALVLEYFAFLSASKKLETAFSLLENNKITVGEYIKKREKSWWFKPQFIVTLELFSLSLFFIAFWPLFLSIKSIY